MSISYDIGFTKKPDDLTKVLYEQGFIINDVERTSFDDGEFQRFIYTSVDDEYGVFIEYLDGVFDDEYLKVIDQNVVATASVEAAMGRFDTDCEKQEEIAKFLRDHYQAILYDPINGKEVTD